MADRLRDVDTAETVFLARALSLTIGAGTIMGIAVAGYFKATRNIGLVSILLVVAAGAIVGAIFGVVAVWLSGAASRGLVAVITGAGNLPPAPSFSYQESLVARGRYQEAADSYRGHLLEHPRDRDARLALAELLGGALGDPSGAVAEYHAIRASRPGPALEYRVTQALIDLHRRTGDRGPLLAELARFAEQHRGTAAGAAAKRELLERKAPDHPA